MPIGGGTEHGGSAGPVTSGAGDEWNRYLADELDEVERAAFEAVCAGQPAQLRGRRLRAAVLKVLCWDPGQLVKGRIVLFEARVTGRLSLADLHLRHGLSFRGCHFADGVDLSRADCDDTVEFDDCELTDLTVDGAKAAKDLRVTACRAGRVSLVGVDVTGELRLSGSRLSGAASAGAASAGAELASNDATAVLDARDLSVGGSLRLDHCQVDGLVTLHESHVDKDLDLRGGLFRNGSAVVLDATSVLVGREVLGTDGFRAEGEVGFQWAQAQAVRFRDAALSTPGGVALRADGLRTTGGLYLDQGCRVTGTVRLVGARIDGEVAATGGTFVNPAGTAIEADRLTAQDLYLDRGCAVTGAVSLIGVELGRQLTCTGGRFDRAEAAAPALDATGLSCGGSVYLNDGFRAIGPVSLLGAAVRKEVNCTGGGFWHPPGPALHADGLTTEGNLLLDGEFQATGGVRLARATVGRQLLCTGGGFEAPDGIALDLAGLVGRGDVKLDRGFHAVGEVRLRNATVDRDLDLTGGQLANGGRPVLTAHGLRVGGCFSLRLTRTPDGPLDLGRATVDRFEDDLGSWPTAGAVLNGFTYGSLESDELTRHERLDVLRRMPVYFQQPYQQLSRVYRAGGKEAAARDVAIEGHVESRRRGNLRWAPRAWNWFLQHFVGYGYKMWRPFVVLLVLGMLNGGLYQWAEQRNLMQPTSVTKSERSHANEAGFVRCPESYPCFNPYAYSFQLLIPGINLQQFDKWIPSAGRDGGWPLLLYTWLMVAVGWILGIAVFGGLNNVLRK